MICACAKGRNEYMKVCIVTLYKSINSGSFLQAKALGTVIEQLGHKVYYYDYDVPYNKTMRKYTGILKVFIKYGVLETVHYIKSLEKFSECQKELSSIKENRLSDIDCFVLGSDTIWNLEGSNLVFNIPVFWGSKFKDSKIITYAGSVANARRELFLSRPELKDAVAKWSRIGVRDTYTYEIISEMTDKEVYMVCDPTFLLQKEDYLGMIKSKDKPDYIFLYLGEKLSEEQSDEMIHFAKENNLKIIQGINGKKLRGVDEIIVNSPMSFLEYMQSAAYVITDTFHGTAFSINLNKNFVVINRNKKKVTDLLQRLNLTERLVTERDSLVLVMKSDITSQDRLVGLRTTSLNFLKNAIGGEYEGNK